MRGIFSIWVSVELASSHVVYISHPAEVAAVIERAAK
jgi:hypothetical protein